LESGPMLNLAKSYQKLLELSLPSLGHDCTTVIAAYFDGSELAVWALDGSDRDITCCGLAGFATVGGRQALTMPGFQNGTISFAETPALPIHETSFTMAFWVHPDDPQSGQPALFADWSYRWSWMLRLWEGRLMAVLRRNINSEGSDPEQDLVSVATPQTLPLGRWSHVALVWDRDAGYLSLFVDCKQVSAGKRAYEEQTIQENDHRVWQIGLKADESSCSFKGAFSQLAVCSRALDAPELTVLSRQGAEATVAP